MKLLTKIALAVVILIAGLLITLQVIDRKKFTQNPGIKPEEINLVREENEERHTLPKINSDVPELKGGPESITRTPGHTTSSTLVFYS